MRNSLASKLKIDFIIKKLNRYEKLKPFYKFISKNNLNGCYVVFYYVCFCSGNCR